MSEEGIQNLIHWSSWLPGPKEVTLDAELFEFGVRVQIVRKVPLSTGDVVNSYVLWVFSINLRPPLLLRSEGFSLPPDLIFDRTTGDSSIRRFLQAGLDLVSREIPGGKFEGESRARLERCFSAIQRHLVDSFLPEAADAANRFPEEGSLRWWVYTLASNDATGRIAQMAHVCPGLILMVRFLRSHRKEEARQLLGLILAGRKLAMILDLATRLWSQAVDSPGNTEKMAAQRIRLARAGHLIPPALLWHCPTCPVIPEDIPRDAQENLVWYQAQMVVSQRAEEFLAGPAKRGVLAFVSRHATALEGASRIAGQSLEQVIIQICDYVRATDRCPGRHTPPEKFLEESRRWHAAMATARNLFFGIGQAPQQYSPNQPLKAGLADGFRAWRCQGNLICFLSTVDELFEESARMQHCVSSYASMAVEGKVQIFHAEVAGEPLTIEIAFRHGKPALQQMAGVRNARPGAEASRIVKIWFEDLYLALSPSTHGKPPKLTGAFDQAGN